MSRVIVITGASEGIGALLARRQGAKGDSIVLGARRQDKLERVAAEQVVKAIEQVIDHPVAEVYTNPSSAILAQRYYQDIPAFEDEMAARNK
jgi:NADP-dependent 3-hydroxy acid dehydrogenase YdfG